ncbi:MAG: hypothetical protein N2445_01425 [Acidobacteria bacterium]|nr:hypothetical protein [Acidobacteriota bacterium]
MVDYFLVFKGDTSFYLYFAYALIGVIIFSYILSLVFRARDKKKE